MQFDLLDNTHNKIISATTYTEFAKLLSNSNCKRCSLCEKRNKIVVDRGSQNAKIMVISERPGDNEDIKGTAFVGKAGELLDKIFAAINLDTNKDMLITNVVKCKPPIERSPTTQEVKACLPYLEKQIQLLQPQIIILLGAVALKYINEDSTEFSMEEQAGRFFTLQRYPGIQFIVLYHPAFLLRDPRRKREMWEHVKTLKSYIDSTMYGIR